MWVSRLNVCRDSNKTVYFYLVDLNITLLLSILKWRVASKSTEIFNILHQEFRNREVLLFLESWMMFTVRKISQPQSWRTAAAVFVIKNVCVSEHLCYWFIIKTTPQFHLSENHHRGLSGTETVYVSSTQQQCHWQVLNADATAAVCICWQHMAFLWQFWHIMFICA